jgi:hypothetical protein
LIQPSTPGNGDGQPSTLSHESDYRRSGSTDSWGSRRGACRQLDGRVTGFESACLLAFGLAAFLAGLVLAWQAIARLVAASAQSCAWPLPWA